jgi:hypothetical protein
LESGASTHIISDVVLFEDIQAFQSEVRVGNREGIPVHGIDIVSLFIVLQDENIKHVMLKDYLYVPGLMKSLFSWSKLKSFNQHYLEDGGTLLVYKIVNDKVILWVRQCLRAYLCNISTRSLEAHTTYTFWYKAIRHPSHYLMMYIKIIYDGDHIPSKLKNFNCDSCLQSKSRHKVLKALQDHVKSLFDIIHSDVYGPSAI